MKNNPTVVDTLPEDFMQENFYQVTVECYNCGHTCEMEILKGKPVNTTPCLNCHCKTLTLA